VSNINFELENPMLLLLLIPAIAFALWPYFRIKKHRRRTRNRVVSMVLHIVILVLIMAVFVNFKVNIKNVLVEQDTIILVDVSESGTSTKKEKDEYIKTILSDYDNSNKVGIVTFGKDVEYVSELSSDAEDVYNAYKKHKNGTDVDATNLEEALLYSKTLLGKDGGRIIILTDGLETDGNALTTAGKLAGDKIQIDAVFFSNELLTKEVQINDLQIPESIELDAETNISVILESASSGMAVIELFDNEVSIAKQEIFLQAGENVVELTHVFKDEGEHLLFANIETKEDTYEQNNRYYTFIDIVLDTKLLFIDGTGTESTKIMELLGNDYDITVVNAADVANDLEELKDYKEIILMNASMKNLPAGFDETLEQYVASGGNVFTTGGTNTYYFGEMKGTKFEDFLPINIVKEEETPIAVVLVLDISTSMNGIMPGSTLNKLNLAKQAAIESVSALRDCDFVSVIAFNKNASVVVPLTPASQRNSIIPKINKITNEVQGTAYVEALRMANTELNGFHDSDIKHVILLSDGEPQDTGYNQVVSSMKNLGITTSSIAIGANTDAFSQKLEDIANIGGGNFYNVTNGLELSRIMVEEIESLKTDYLNEDKDIAIRIRSHTSVVKGVSSLPTISGYVGSSAKDAAVVVLQAQGDPIYAQWDYGEGTVGSFTSDLNGTWTSNFFTDANATKFIKNVVQNLISTENMQSEFEVSFARDNYTNVINVVTSSANGQNKVAALITYPDDTSKIIELTLTSNNTYSAVIPDYGVEGLYKIDLTKTSGKATVTESCFTTFAYSEEYDMFYNQDDSYAFVEELVKKGKGDLFTETDDVFSDELLYHDITYNPHFGLLIAALILFLLDIVVRKFNFKWPHEIWGKKKKEIEANA